MARFEGFGAPVVACFGPVFFGFRVFLGLGLGQGPSADSDRCCVATPKL